MSATQEIEAGARFRFGANWARFLSTVDERRIIEAELSLKEMLGVADLEGQRFLDMGSGSGLFSLAARRLGATVHSIDFDPQSVACTHELKRRYFPDDKAWRVEEGSVLDADYLTALGQFDVVYSWGVLHHTGAMWVGIEHAIGCVAGPKGTLFIAIYNDQGWKSHLWWFVKLIYNRLPHGVKPPFVLATTTLARLAVVIKHAIHLRPIAAIAHIFESKEGRGMSAKYDAIDWVGGFPYEFAAFETLSTYFEARGFQLMRARRTSSWGCNELVLQRTSVVN